MEKYHVVERDTEKEVMTGERKVHADIDNTGASHGYQVVEMDANGFWKVLSKGYKDVAQAEAVINEMFIKEQGE